MRFLNVICQKVLTFFFSDYICLRFVMTLNFSKSPLVYQKKKKFLNEEKGLLRRYTSLIREKETIQGY